MNYDIKVGDRLKTDVKDVTILEVYSKQDGDRGPKCKYKCNHCGYEGVNYVYLVVNSKRGCQVCGKNAKIVDAAYNSLGALYPDLLEYLDDPVDAQKLLPGSQKKIMAHCPLCGSKKITTPYRLTLRGFHCDNCAQSISYPNRLMREVLLQLGVRFKTEASFTWSNKRRYDFYLPDHSCIIEMHGSQHYKGGFGRSYEEIHLNDIYKKQLALSNNILHYIEIDCSNGDPDLIKNKMLENTFLLQLKVDSVDFIRCNNNIRKDNTPYLQVLRLWQSKKTIRDIADIMNLSTVWVRKILVDLTNMQLTDYNAEKNKRDLTAKRVLDTSTGRVYESILQCRKELGVAGSTICNSKKKRFRIMDEKEYNDYLQERKLT